MKAILELDPEGGLYLSPDFFESLKPHTRFRVLANNGTLILRPEESETELPLWATATSEEQAESLLQWVESIKEGADLPDEALRRENMYD